VGLLSCTLVKKPPWQRSSEPSRSFRPTSWFVPNLEGTARS
jgi:hypothetical protein